jgi:hypothetical protein
MCSELGNDTENVQSDVVRLWVALRSALRASELNRQCMNKQCVNRQYVDRQCIWQHVVARWHDVNSLFKQTTVCHISVWYRVDHASLHLPCALRHSPSLPHQLPRRSEEVTASQRVRESMEGGKQRRERRGEYAVDRQGSKATQTQTHTHTHTVHLNEEMVLDETRVGTHANTQATFWVVFILGSASPQPKVDLELDNLRAIDWLFIGFLSPTLDVQWTSFRSIGSLSALLAVNLTLLRSDSFKNIRCWPSETLFCQCDTRGSNEQSRHTQMETDSNADTCPSIFVSRVGFLSLHLSLARPRSDGLPLSDEADRIPGARRGCSMRPASVSAASVSAVMASAIYMFIWSKINSSTFSQKSQIGTSAPKVAFDSAIYNWITMRVMRLFEQLQFLCLFGGIRGTFIYIMPDYKFRWAL